MAPAAELKCKRILGRPYWTIKYVVYEDEKPFTLTDAYRLVRGYRSHRVCGQEYSGLLGNFIVAREYLQIHEGVFALHTRGQLARMP